MTLTEKQKRALAGLATPGEDNQKFHAGVMPLASDEGGGEGPAGEFVAPASSGMYLGLKVGM